VKTGMSTQSSPAARMTHRAMGTVMTHKAFGEYAQDCLATVGMEIARLENLLSCYLPGSEINHINDAAGLNSEKVSCETYEILTKAVEFSQYLPGSFDVTIGPLVNLWSTGRDSLTPPDEVSIQQVLPLINYRDLVLDPWKMTAGLRNMGQSIDLGGIGKGFSGDRILDIFKKYGISSAHSNLGGNVVTLGSKPDGDPWQIGIQHPRQENRLIGALAVVDRSVVTSGDYQRCFTDKRGITHHHILDPFTGYPSHNNLISVTIVAERSLAADALSTMVFVAGMDRGLELVKSFPQTEAIFVDRDMQVFITKGLKGQFQADKDICLSILK